MNFHLLRLYRRPKLSVIVVVHDMAREAPRTLLSLSVKYQREMTAEDYEVIVVDNGSPTPLGEKIVKSFGRNFFYHYLEDAPPSPAHAVNLGVELARGQYVGVMVDGARILTPGVLYFATMAFKMQPDATVATMGWHLGREPQTVSVARGYDKDAEDALLDHIDWPSNGYRLFEISSLALSSNNGWFLPIAESNCVFMRKSSFERIGGFDVAFNMPGGGLVNGDFFLRACECRQFPLILLLGEGSFHQVHGGIATNATSDTLQRRSESWASHYQALRHKPFSPEDRRPIYLGEIPDEALKFINHAVQKALTGGAHAG